MVKLPAVAVKTVELEPEGTVTDAGTLKAGLSLESATAVPPAGAACEIVTVQLAVPPVPKLAGAQFSPVTNRAVTRETVAVWELLPSVAVTVAD